MMSVEMIGITIGLRRIFEPARWFRPLSLERYVFQPPDLPEIPNDKTAD
jgi:hypothetical protein